MNTASLSRSAGCIGSQTLNDLLDTASADSCVFVLKESATNVRDLQRAVHRRTTGVIRGNV